MSVRVKDLTKIYGEQAAVDQVSFELNSGEILGFLGPNGAGKSTTMKMITGYLTPSAGGIWICGQPIDEDPTAAKKLIGYLPEHNPLYLDMYVAEYLHFVSKLYGLSNSKRRVEEMIEKTGLTLERKKRIADLSKGFRQRVGLAQAMIHDPQILILDEPTSGLDPNQLAEIRALIQELGREKAVILSTHIMQEVKLLCDRVIIINHGKIVANESTDELASADQNNIKLVIKFLNPVDKQTLMSIPSVIDVRTHPDNFYELTASDHDVRIHIYDFTVRYKNPLLILQDLEVSIEDIFRKLTRE